MWSEPRVRPTHSPGPIYTVYVCSWPAVVLMYREKPTQWEKPYSSFLRREPHSLNTAKLPQRLVSHHLCYRGKGVDQPKKVSEKGLIDSVMNIDNCFCIFNSSMSTCEVMKQFTTIKSSFEAEWDFIITIYLYRYAQYYARRKSRVG